MGIKPEQNQKGEGPTPRESTTGMELGREKKNWGHEIKKKKQEKQGA